jgi:hypothetical protein
MRVKTKLVTVRLDTLRRASDAAQKFVAAKGDVSANDALKLAGLVLALAASADQP